MLQEYLKLNKNILIAFAASLIISAIIAQLLSEQTEYLNATYTTIADYLIYFSVFSFLFYLDNRKKYVLESGKTDTVKLKHDLKKLITSLGGTVVEIDDSRVYPGEDEYFLLLYEFRVGLEDYLEKSTGRHKTLESLIDFNLNNAEKVMPHFEQEIFYKSMSTLDKDDEYLKALEMVARVRNEFDELLKINDQPLTSLEALC